MIPKLNLNSVTSNQQSHAPNQFKGQNLDAKKVNGERGYLMEFFEKFHDAHEQLTEVSHFSKDDFFKESYMIEALAVGLPNNFVCAADQDYQQLSARSGRSSNANTTSTDEQQKMHQELAMLSNIKAYYKERQIDVTDIISQIKQEKRIASSMDTEGDDKVKNKIYWQLATLIFTAFYLDHSQNDYLGDYFAQRLQTSVQRLKLSLEIVQGLLTKTEIFEEEETDEYWALDVSNEASMNKGDLSINDILKADPSQWDAFRDAHLFEARAAAEQNLRKQQVQDQFDLIRSQENEERDRLESVERTEDLEQSIQLAENKIQHKDAMLRQKDYDQAVLLEDRERLEAEVKDKELEIVQMEQRLAYHVTLERQNQQSLSEMNKLLVRLQDKASQNTELQQALHEKEQQLQEIGQERNRLADEARVSRLSMNHLGGDDDIAAQLSGRAFQESSPARRRREKQEEARRERERQGKQQAMMPEIEMTKMKAGAYANLSQNEFETTPYKAEFDDFDDLKKELGGDVVDGTFAMGAMEHDGMTGEEYFETNPNDTSYEMEATDNTNRDFMIGDDLDNSVPIDMRSPDVTQILEQEKGNFSISELDDSGVGKQSRSPNDKKKDDKLLKTQLQLQNIQGELSEYRVRCSRQKERIEHIERLNGEHESLYTEFLVRSIKAERTKRQLERRLARINYIIAFFSKFQCSKVCFRSWIDPNQFTWQRGVKIGVVFIFFILFILMIAI